MPPDALQYETLIGPGPFAANLDNMKLPNAEFAIVDLEKLIDYCLNPEHPRGKHKARVFEAACGLTAEYSEAMRIQLLEAAVKNDAVPLLQDTHGLRYVIEFTLK
jgi:hypothetical protein